MTAPTLESLLEKVPENTGWHLHRFGYFAGTHKEYRFKINRHDPGEGKTPHEAVQNALEKMKGSEK